MNTQLRKEYPKKEKKPKPLNPIEEAIRTWKATFPDSLLEEIAITVQGLLSNVPKRWVAYPPMLLLPSGSFNIQGDNFALESGQILQELWKTILETVSQREGKGTLTHLAINCGIPLESSKGDNILRSPSGLIMLYGDFGPALSPNHEPTAQDFAEALWVQTKQNGIVQVWAPRYTMFSRGNIKEKARLLDFHAPREGVLEKRKMTREEVGERVAVDLYAGIGYFVFSYVKMGVRRVMGWELNPWSVEGLRRGAVANGWSVKVVRPGEESDSTGHEKIVVFLDDNRKALNFIENECSQERVLHVNGGLLPTSEPSWRDALKMIKMNGWLHLHENVGVKNIEKRRQEIETIFHGWIGSNGLVVAEHAELVKTFAPGVWHCVFDVYIDR